MLSLWYQSHSWITLGSHARRVSALNHTHLDACLVSAFRQFSADTHIAMHFNWNLVSISEIPKPPGRGACVGMCWVRFFVCIVMHTRSS